MYPLEVEVRAHLKAHHVALSHSLGQNFLMDEDVLETIVESADISEDDHIVEIGPGIGVLTRLLIEQAKKVTAIELDSHLLAPLTTFVSKTEGWKEKLEIVQGNALSVGFPKDPYKIVANIPYHITSPLLRHAFLESRPPESLTLLIQKEVAEKICDTKHRGLLTIIVGLFGTPSIVCKVPARCFIPPPEVESAVLHIEGFKEPLADSKTIDQVMRLAKMGFSQKRKMLRNSLGNTDEGMEQLKKAGIDPARRPETISIEEWIRLAKIVG